MIFTLKTIFQFYILKSEDDNLKIGVKNIKEHVYFYIYILLCNIITNSLLIYYVQKNAEQQQQTILQLLGSDALLAMLIEFYIILTSYYSHGDGAVIILILSQLLTSVIFTFMSLKKFNNVPFFIKFDMILTIVCFVYLLIYSAYLCGKTTNDCECNYQPLATNNNDNKTNDNKNNYQTV